ncbi:hypothetical protein R5R35_007678 [Gryllus longicercus]|uniref:Mothers against decapentaplegic homolog n=1 Tax=Gryllus longicercus TaxID=2509291 RepID=A0AAN9VPM3_9ORTH
MFMFRSRRTALAKRLWRARARRDSDPPAAAATVAAGSAPRGSDAAAAATLLRRLRAPQLEALLAAVESRGADATACVLLPRSPPPPPEPHLLCCQTWRWPDLRSPAELKRLPACAAAAAAADDPALVCVNPYHWSRLCRPESPPPPYSRVEAAPMTVPAPDPAADPVGGGGDASCVRSSTAPCSLATGGGASGEGAGRGGRAWCRLAYWELAVRVGRLFAVEAPSVDVFGAAPRGDGLCLSTLADAGAGAGSGSGSGSGSGGGGAGPAGAGANAPDAVRRARAKIGLGVTLSCEVDGVWAYNRSDGPIFVNSPTLDDPDSRTLLVYRVPPGHCINVFEHAKAEEARRRRRQLEQLTQSGPTDPNSVRISFAKGWGPKYSRQEVTACPCWIEVLLAPCR